MEVEQIIRLLYTVSLIAGLIFTVAAVVLFLLCRKTPPIQLAATIKELAPKPPEPEPEPVPMRRTVTAKIPEGVQTSLHELLRSGSPNPNWITSMQAGREEK